MSRTGLAVGGATEIRWGVVGAADIAREIIPAIMASRNGRVAALASRRPDASQRLAQTYGIPKVYENYEGLLEDPSIDAVYVLLINSLHREWTLRALEANKHVLCEKPLAPNAAEAEDMAAMARRQDRLLMEAVMYRFHPRMQELRERIRGVSLVHASFGYPMVEVLGRETYRAKHALGGGVLLDVGSYCVSVARWFLGEPESLTAGARLSNDVDMTVSAALTFSGGQLATLWCSFESLEREGLLLVCDDGPITVERPFTDNRGLSFQLEVEAFAQSVLDGLGAPLPVADSISNLRVIDRIREAAGIRWAQELVGL